MANVSAAMVKELRDQTGAGMMDCKAALSETGGNLAEILDNLSYVIRERFKIQRQVRVYTAQGRLTMALLMGMPPIIVTVMLTLNPSFIRPLFSDPIGHTLLVAGITLQTIGYFVIRKIIRIQV